MLFNALNWIGSALLQCLSEEGDFMQLLFAADAVAKLALAALLALAYLCVGLSFSLSKRVSLPGSQHV